MHAGDETCGHSYVRIDDGRAVLGSESAVTCKIIVQLLAVIFVANPPLLSELVNEIEQRKSPSWMRCPSRTDRSVEENNEGDCAKKDNLFL